MSEPVPCVLVMDDDLDNLNLIESLLRSSGLDVVAASEWSEVSRALFRGESRLDGALIDVMMPALRGDRLVGILRRYLPVGAPILLYSALPQEQLEVLARESGADGFLQKGMVSGLDMVREVRDWLAKGARALD